MSEPTAEGVTKAISNFLEHAKYAGNDKLRDEYIEAANLLAALSLPSADRGPIIEECARVAKARADFWNAHARQDHAGTTCAESLADECEDIAQAIRALSSSPAQTGGWRPIETAPKGATEVLLLVPTHMGWPKQYRIVGHWADGGGDEQPRFRGWFRNDSYGFREISDEPTHWQPLPAPPILPTAQGKEGEK